MIAPVFHCVRSICAIPFYPPNIPRNLRKIDDDDETRSLKVRRTGREENWGKGDCYRCSGIGKRVRDGKTDGSVAKLSLFLTTHA